MRPVSCDRSAPSPYGVRVSSDGRTNGCGVWLLDSVVGTTKPKIIGCIVTNPRLREPTPVIVDRAASGASRRADDTGPSTNVGYIHRREKRYDSTAAAAADTGIRPATPQRMRHSPRRPPGARHHHSDCDIPRRIRPAWLDFQLTMAARTSPTCSVMKADWHDRKRLDRPIDGHARY